MALFWNFSHKDINFKSPVCQNLKKIYVIGFRIHKDLVEPEKLHATLTDGTLNQPCDLKKALEMVTLLEAQLKEMNPNFDSIAEYAFTLY